MKYATEMSSLFTQIHVDLSTIATLFLHARICLGSIAI